jgi:outer membrane protein
MKRLIFFLAMAFSISSHAQDTTVNDSIGNDALYPIFSPTAPFIGYLSYDSILVNMPQYAIVEKQMSDMRQAYDKELKRAEEEFNEKYEAFLEGRKDFPRTILLKRQNELEQLLQRNVEFKQQSLKHLEQARQEAMAPLRQQLSQAIAQVAQNRKLAVVLNTDDNACLFIDPALSVDIDADVRMELAK